MDVSRDYRTVDEFAESYKIRLEDIARLVEDRQLIVSIIPAKCKPVPDWPSLVTQPFFLHPDDALGVLHQSDGYPIKALFKTIEAVEQACYYWQVVWEGRARDLFCLVATPNALVITDEAYTRFRKQDIWKKAHEAALTRHGYTTVNERAAKEKARQLWSVDATISKAKMRERCVGDGKLCPQSWVDEVHASMKLSKNLGGRPKRNS